MKPIKKKARITKILFLLITVFSLSLTNYYVLTSDIAIEFPQEIINQLKKRKVDLKIDQLETRILPYPHFSIKAASLKIAKKIKINIDDIQINLDIFNLLSRSKIQVSSIIIGRVQVNYFDKQIATSKAVYSKPKPENLQQMLQDAEVTLNSITSYFRITKYLTVHFITFDIHKNDAKPSQLFQLSALELTNLGHDRMLSVLSFNTNMYEWLSSNVRFEIQRQKKTDSDENNLNSVLQYVTINIESDFFLDKLREQFMIDKLKVSGSIKLNQKIRLKFPFEKVEQEFEAIGQNFDLITPDTHIFIDKTDQAKVKGKLTITSEKIVSDSLWFSYRGMTVPTKYKYFFKEKLMSWRAKTTKALSLRSFFKLTGNQKLRRFVPSEALLYPRSVSYELDTKNFRYQTSFSYPVYGGLKFKFPGSLIFKGFLRGSEGVLRASNVKILGSNSDLKLLNAKVYLHGGIRVKGKVYGSLDLADLTKSGTGSLKVDTELNCKRLAKEWSCQKKYLNINGDNLFIKSGFATRLFRILNVNMLDYWKSLKQNSEIGISQIRSKGSISGNSMNFRKIEIKSDIGDFNINGSWKPLKGKGKFTLKVSPLGLDSLITKIPLIGKPINATLEYATLMIFDLELRQNRLRINSVSIGKVMKEINTWF